MSDIPYQFQYEYPAEQPDPHTTYAEFFPPLGQMGGPNQPWPLAYGVDPIDFGAYRDRDLLLVAEPVDPDSGPTLGLFAPLGDMLYPDGGEWGWKGGKIVIWPATTAPRSSDNDDVPAAIYVHGGLPASPNFASSLFDGVDPLTRSRTTVGVATKTASFSFVPYLKAIYMFDTTGAAVTGTLPDARTLVGMRVQAKKINIGGSAATIATTNSQTIDGSATKVLTDNEYVELVAQGTSTAANWYII